MTTRPARSHVEARPHTSGLALSSLPVLLLPRMDIFPKIKVKGQGRDFETGKSKNMKADVYIGKIGYRLNRSDIL